MTQPPPERAGPTVVALGGGHGLAATLAAARRYAGRITAVASVADDGGSSGRLRAALGIPAPGDLRRCLVALADPANVWARTFEHRFSEGELTGHSVGNLVIAGLTATVGDFGTALREACRLVGAVGEVLPATVDPVVLKAEVAGGGLIEGQVQVASVDAPIARVSLVPPDARPPAEVLRAIAEADQVVLGPGSLYTSVLAVTAVPAIREALSATTAVRVYVCNLRPETHESRGFDGLAHLAALAEHGVEVDAMLHDPAHMPLGAARGAGGPAVRIVSAAVARPDGSAHDPARLGEALARLLA